MDDQLTTPTDESPPPAERVGYDSPFERLQLLGGDDDQIAAFLDELEVRSPREREMLSEIARPTPIARPERFETDHRLALVALESLRRHGHHGARAGERLGRLRVPVRFLVELVARYVVVTHVKEVAMNLRNLYWMRELESVEGSPEREALSRARTAPGPRRDHQEPRARGADLRPRQAARARRPVAVEAR